MLRRAQRREPMSEEYPYNGRLSRWEEIADGLAIVGVEALEEPWHGKPFSATLVLPPLSGLVLRPDDG